MPAYLYQCTNCQVEEARIGGVDDHFTRGKDCHHLLLRLGLDLFAPYFAPWPNSGESANILDQTSEKRSWG